MDYKIPCTAEEARLIDEAAKPYGGDIGMLATMIFSDLMAGMKPGETLTDALARRCQPDDSADYRTDDDDSADYWKQN